MDAFLGHITWPEFAARVEGTLVVLPVGSVEQHGPHLPLGTDVLIAWHLAGRLAERLRGLVAPPIWYAGPSDPGSGGGLRFPGTMALPGSVLSASVAEILRECFRHGAGGIAVLNGHFENTAFLVEAAREVRPPDDRTGRRIVLLNWWEHISDALLARAFGGRFPGWEAEHAGVMETSLMHVFEPHLVHVERIPPDAPPPPVPRHRVFPEPEGWVPASGILHRAAVLPPDLCEAIVAHILDAFGRALAAEFPWLRT
jgi:creatinine amidohydrolase